MESASRKRIRKCSIQTPQITKEAPRKQLRKCSTQIPRVTIEGPLKRLRKCSTQTPQVTNEAPFKLSRKCSTQTPHVIKEAPLKRLIKFSSRITRVIKNDFFCLLTDDIIVSHILSRLSLEEAARCSILSHRWFKMWIQSIPSKLTFSYSAERLFPSQDIYYDNYPDEFDNLRRVFARGISYILGSHQNPTLDELNICFDFGLSCSSAIDSWVEHAFSKGVTRLELDLSPWVYPTSSTKYYTFPGIEKVTQFLAMCPNNVHGPINSPGLRDVCLKAVEISAEVIHLILAACPSLERLCTLDTNINKEVRVSEQASKLKYLEFDSGGRIRISSSSLISLHYNGVADGLCIEHAPLLSELSIGRHCSIKFLREVSAGNHPYISRLKRLTLSIRREYSLRFTSCLLQFPELIQLEQLTVKVVAYAHLCLLWPILLIKAAPSLHTFSVELCCTSLDGLQQEGEDLAKERDIRDAIKLTGFHGCLKWVEMHGFCGFPCELELGQHLLGTSETLEQVAVWQHKDVDRLWSARNCGGGHAKQLSDWVPPGAELLIYSRNLGHHPIW